MTNQHQAQHEQSKADPRKTEPATIPFVVAVTPEQYDARIKQAASAPKDAPPRPQMNVGDIGIAKVSFTDESGGDVKIVSSTWTSMGPVTVTPPPEVSGTPSDPTTANLTATGPGRAPIQVSVVTESGATAEAATEIMVIETGKPAVGKIDVTVTPAKAK